MNIFEGKTEHKKENDGTAEDSQGIFAKADEIERIIMADRNREKDKERYYEMFRDFFIANGAVEKQLWNDELHMIAHSNGKILVRRDDPENVMGLFKGGKDFAVHASRYGEQPNAALLGSDLHGLRIALAGGFGKIGRGSIAFTVGFNPSEGMRVADVPQAGYDHFEGLDRQLSKVVSGKTSNENVKFVLMRMPRSFFPEKYMTDSELDHEDVGYIQRIYLLHQKKEPNT